jgi:hypothetical protein
VNHRPGWSVPATECCHQSAYMPMRRLIQSPSQGQILRRHQIMPSQAFSVHFHGLVSTCRCRCGCSGLDLGLARLARICAGERWWQRDLLLQCSGDVHCRGDDSGEVNVKRQRCWFWWAVEGGDGDYQNW